MGARGGPDPRDEDFVAFVHGCSRRLQRLAGAVCPDPARAQDLVQDALVAAYGHWPAIKDTDPFAYTRASLINANLSYWRRRPWRERLGAVVDDVPDPVVPTEQLDRRDLLLAGLRTLTARERTVIVLRYLEELTERETADTLHIAVGTVKSTSARALGKLRTALELTDEQV
jgi:RNA polymerase sigma-70 factor (sigma-E family)